MTRSHHANQWILVDARMQVLSIGTAQYHGTSPRTSLDPIARHILIPRIRVATLHGHPRTDTTRHDGRSWTTRVLPIHGPVTETPLAVLALYGHEPFPEPPLIGAWEWKITPPGPHQEMRTYWSPTLFDVYGIPRPSTPDASFWEAAQWLDELIHDSDRVSLRRRLDAFLTATTDALIFHTYRVKDPTTGTTHHLRYAGRPYLTEPHPPLWLRGISFRTDPHHTPSTESHDIDEILHAAFSLSPDPLCAIDTTYEHIYLTCAGFADLGLALPPHRHLPTMTHPDDLPGLRGFLTDAARLGTTPTGPIRVRFAATRGDWITLTLSGTGLRLLHTDDPHHVLCRVTHDPP